MRKQMRMVPLCLLAFLCLSFMAAKDAQAGAPRVTGTLTGVVDIVDGAVSDCVGELDEVSVEFSYDLDDIDESSSGGGVYEFAQAWPDNFLSISISSACNELTWTTGESFTILISDGSVDLFDVVGEPLFNQFPDQYGEPSLMGFELRDVDGEMITMENGDGSVPFFRIHPQQIDDGWGQVGQIGGPGWYIEFIINAWEITEEPAQAQAPRVTGTLTGVVDIVDGAVSDCVGELDEVSVEFSYDLDDIDESSSGGGVYEFAQAWPDNFLSISISSACNGLTWTTGESFTIGIGDGSVDSFNGAGEPPFQEFSDRYTEPEFMGIQLLDNTGEMITMADGPGPVPFFSIHPQYIEEGWGLVGHIGGVGWYIEFTINTWQITEEPDMNPVAVAVDIKPRGCKNRVKLWEKRGYLNVAILGTEDLDVTTIDPASVMLEGVSAARWHYRDATEPSMGEPEYDPDCTNGSPDGYTDLILKFKRNKIIKALKALGYVGHREWYLLQLSGEMLDDMPIGGEDAVYTLNNKKKNKKNKKNKKKNK